jgi:hypothetical protein
VNDGRPFRSSRTFRFRDFAKWILIPKHVAAILQIRLRPYPRFLFAINGFVGNGSAAATDENGLSHHSAQIIRTNMRPGTTL